MTTLAEETAEKVNYKEGPEVSDVPIVIYGGAARVHSNKVVGRRSELFNLAR